MVEFSYGFIKKFKRGDNSMALFRNQKLNKLEETFFREKTFGEGEMSFNLTLIQIIPYPKEIMQYRWIVKLADGHEFETYMGEQLLSIPYTRLKDIQEKITSHSSILNSEQLAQKIDSTIQSIFNEYK